MKYKALIFLYLFIGAEYSSSFVCKGVDYFQGEMKCKFWKLCKDYPIVNSRFNVQPKSNGWYYSLNVKPYQLCSGSMIKCECKSIDTVAWMTQLLYPRIEKMANEILERKARMKMANLSVPLNSAVSMIPVRDSRSAFRYFYPHPATTTTPQLKLMMSSGATSTVANNAMDTIRKKITDDHNQRLIWICSVIGVGVGMLVLIICICVVRRWLSIFSDMRPAGNLRRQNARGNIQRSNAGRHGNPFDSNVNL